MKKFLSLVLALLLAVSCLPVMAGAEGNKVYHTYIKADTPTLNVHNSVETSLDVPTDYCNAYLYRPVPNEDGKGFHYIGDLAAELPVQMEDGVTWEIKLRTDAKWANGDPINADTVIYSWKQLLNPMLVNSMSNKLASNNITIANAAEYAAQGDSATVAWEDVGIKKIDDYTIQLVLTSDTFTQANVCAHFNTRATTLVYEPFYEAGMTEDKTQTTYGATADQYMSCGPYMLDTWTFDSIQIYTRNPNYWQPELFHYDTVEVRVIPEMNARVELWESGLLDDMQPDANTIETYIDDPRLVEYPSNTVYHIDVNAFNPNNPLCGSNNYRKALFHAMDRKTIAEKLFGYNEGAGWYINGLAGILSDSGVTYRTSTQGKSVEEAVNATGEFGYNPELAREYLAKAYEECGVPADTVLNLVIAFDPGESYWKKTAEYLQEQFPVIFDGKVTLEIVNYSGISTTQYKKSNDTWDLSPNDWSNGSSSSLPHKSFAYFISGYSSHPNNFLDEEFDAQYDVCENSTGDYEKLLDETAKLETIYLDKVINLPMVQEVKYQLFSDRLVLPVTTYIPGLGWGTIYGDIAE